MCYCRHLQILRDLLLKPFDNAAFKAFECFGIIDD